MYSDMENSNVNTTTSVEADYQLSSCTLSRPPGQFLNLNSNLFDLLRKPPLYSSSVDWIYLLRGVVGGSATLTREILNIIGLQSSSGSDPKHHCDEILYFNMDTQGKEEINGFIRNYGSATIYLVKPMMVAAAEELKSVISPRPSFNRNMSMSLSNLAQPSIGGTKVLRIIREISTSMANGINSGPATTQQMIDEREKEKLEMQQLNDKLAGFIEKVRFFDAQNKHLSREGERLNRHLAKDRPSKVLYETEVSGAEKILNDMKEENTVRDKDLKKLNTALKDWKEKFDSANDGCDDERDKLDELLVEYSNIEAEINLYKRRIALKEENVGYKKKQNAAISALLHSTQMKLDQEALLALHGRAEIEGLLQEIKFRSEGFDEELRDLLALASRDTTSENREYFKNELSNAMREIRDEHDRVHIGYKQEMETTLQREVHEIHTQSAKQNIETTHLSEETKRLKTQTNDMRNRLAELQGRNAVLERKIEEFNHQMEDDQRMFDAEINDKDSKIRNARGDIEEKMMDIQMLNDSKQTLANELDLYRNMLEGEGQGLQQLVENVVKTTALNEVQDTETMRIIRGESISKVAHMKSAKGNIAIMDVCPEGTYIIVGNTHRKKNENVSGWKLKRKIDGRHEIVYTFPEDFSLKGGQSIKIVTKGHVDENQNDVLVYDGQSFGNGNSVSTYLYNADGQERASVTQRQTDSEVREESNT